MFNAPMTFRQLPLIAVSLTLVIALALSVDWLAAEVLGMGSPAARWWLATAVLGLVAASLATLLLQERRMRHVELDTLASRTAELEHERADLQRRTRSYRAQARQIQSVLSALAEPVLVIDKRDQLVLSNSSANRLLAIDTDDSAEQRAVQSLVHCEQLVHLLTDTRKHKRFTERDCEIEVADGEGTPHWFRVTAQHPHAAGRLGPRRHLAGGRRADARHQHPADVAEAQRRICVGRQPRDEHAPGRHQGLRRIARRRRRRRRPDAAAVSARYRCRGRPLAGADRRSGRSGPHRSRPLRSTPASASNRPAAGGRAPLGTTRSDRQQHSVASGIEQLPGQGGRGRTDDSPGHAVVIGPRRAGDADRGHGIAPQPRWPATSCSKWPTTARRSANKTARGCSRSSTAPRTNPARSVVAWACHW